MEQHNERQQKWDDLATKFAQVTDRLGKPIDEPIMETVIVLNALDLPTAMSCGGHIEEGKRFATPWVDIEEPTPAFVAFEQEASTKWQEAEKLDEEVIRLRQQEASENEAFFSLVQQRDAMYRKMHALRYQARLLQCPVRRKLVAYLVHFYMDRVVPFDQRLILAKFASGRTRLHIQGREDFYLDAPLKVQEQKLSDYRAEMGAFTHFLKEVYFSS